MVTVEEAERILSLDKTAISPMSWKSITSMSLSVDGELIENLRLICSYIPLPKDLPDCYSFSLLYNNQRIYAIDKELYFKTHHNKKDVGHGRLYYNQTIRGTHEHHWTTGGYGYAEPLCLGTSAEHKDYWHHAINMANIMFCSSYCHPVKGQQFQLFGGG